MTDDRPWSRTQRAAEIERNRQRLRRDDRRAFTLAAIAWLIVVAVAVWLLSRQP